MIQIKGIQFCDSIGVIYSLKELKGHNTLQETYKELEKSDLDTALMVLRISYNKLHKENSLNEEQFIEFLEEHQIGFVLITQVYKQLVEALLFSGMTPEEIENTKKILAKPAQ